MVWAMTELFEKRASLGSGGSRRLWTGPRAVASQRLSGRN
jgi:hypothetical protein